MSATKTTPEIYTTPNASQETTRKVKKNIGSIRLIFKNLGILLSGRAINAPLSIVHTTLATGLLGIYDFGLLTMVYAFARLIGDVVEFQSWQTVIHYGYQPFKENHKEQFQRVIRFSLFLDVSSGIAGTLFGIFFGIFFGYAMNWPTKLSIIGPAFCIIILFMTSATAIGILRLLNRFDLLAIQSVNSTVVRLIGTIIATLTHGTLTDLLIVWVIAEISSFFLLGFLAWKELDKHHLAKGLLSMRDTKWYFGKDMTKGLDKVWSFAFTTNINTTLYLASGQLVTVIVGSLLGPTSAGIYQIANKMAAAFAKPAGLIENTLYPEMTKLWHDKKTKKLYRLAFQITLLAGGVATLLMLLAHYIGTPLLAFILHKANNPQAANLMFWLLGAEVITIWGLPLEPLLITTRKTRLTLIARGLTTFLFLLLLIITIHHFGLLGIGPATIFSTLFLLILQLLFVLKNR
ncbi:lipopolysaccharide biosynthesis protein [Entomobacter blattae]|uniref:Polysaccharide biosynthesis protein n=1 Tax=Entomobacter blattae TaxID=2762277 RepID=A0A7H1NP94_9PROT|nr:lipopolysaccharide biosynthesis protein [Entomobacter blattae]QNT77604.1 Polysaccharide biosynthesis protein [Entomobacter blattae]